MKKTETVVKTDLAENWEKAVNYIPANGTIIVYEYEDGAPRVKIGNGIMKVGELPFLSNPPPQVSQDVLEF